MVIFWDIIHHQIMGNPKAALLSFRDTNLRVKNGYACSIEPNHRKVFSHLDYKNSSWITFRALQWTFEQKSVDLYHLQTEEKNCFEGTWRRTTMIKPPCHISRDIKDSGMGIRRSCYEYWANFAPLARNFIVPAAKLIGKKTICSSSTRINRYSNPEENTETSLKDHRKFTISKTIK